MSAKQTRRRTVSSIQPESRILIAGCGQVLPYIIAKWSPGAHIDCVDISQATLKSAKIRTGFQRSMVFHHQTIEAFLEQIPKDTYDHIDAYGLLHHLANPAQVIERLAQVLKPTGTLRLMVYNTPGRAWIRHLQKAIALTAGERLEAQTLAQARALISVAQNHFPNIRFFLDMLGDGLRRDSHFVDTFMHRREAQLAPRWWFETLSKNNLSIYSLFDRYGELDHLPNPLFDPPVTGPLIQRLTTNLTLSGNLEVYCLKNSPQTDQATVQYDAPPLGLTLKTSPNIWWTFPETKHVPRRLKNHIWKRFLKHLQGNEASLTEIQDILPFRSLQRLARIGAIHPRQLPQETQDALNRPLETYTPPTLKNPTIPSIDVDWTQVRFDLDEKKRASIEERLKRAENWCAKHRALFEGIPPQQ